MLVLALVLGLVGVAAASDLGNQAPVKSPVSYPVNVPNGERQGGDTIANAWLIPAVPYTDNGTTVGYTDDYDEVCPYTGSTSPDVVYRFVPAATVSADVDLCNSSYDTKLYIYDASLNLIACNDDFNVAPCYVYSSKLQNVTFNAGTTYYIIVDGYFGASGAYVLDIVPPPPPCVLELPNFNPAEGEPALNPNYIDSFNGGCNYDTVSPPFQTIYGALMPGSDIPAGTAIFAGRSGWYLNAGAETRDTDWFILHKAVGQPLEITLDAEYATAFYELTVQSCPTSVGLTGLAGPCAPGYMTITNAAANGNVWFWVGPTVYGSPDGTNMYDYVVWFSGLAPEVVPTQSQTWSTVKALYE
jgi:hypothetical protein